MLFLDLAIQCVSVSLATSPHLTPSPGVRGMTHVTPTPAAPELSVSLPGREQPASAPRDTRETPSCHAGNILINYQ